MLAHVMTERPHPFGCQREIRLMAEMKMPDYWTLRIHPIEAIYPLGVLPPDPGAGYFTPGLRENIGFSRGSVNARKLMARGPQLARQNRDRLL